MCNRYNSVFGKDSHVRAQLYLAFLPKKEESKFWGPHIVPPPPPPPATSWLVSTQRGVRIGTTVSTIFRRVRKIAKSYYFVSSCLYVVLHGTTRLPLDGFFLWNLVPEYFFFGGGICWGNLKFLSNLTSTKGTVHEDRCTFMIISRWIILRMKNVLGKSGRRSQNTHFMFKNVFAKIAPFMR